MKGDEFVGYLPKNQMILPNDEIVFMWRTAKDKDYDWYLYNSKNSSTRSLRIDEQFSFPLNGFIWNKAKTLALYSNKGNLFIWDTKFQKPKSIFQTSDYCSNPVFSKDEKSVFFQQNDNLYQLQLSETKLTQITNFQKTSQKEDIKLDYLSNQELLLMDNLQEKAAQKNIKNHKQSGFDHLLPLKIFINKQSVQNISISPDEKRVVYVLRKNGDRNYTKVPNFISEDGYTTSNNARPKVGRDEDGFKLYFYDIPQRKTFEFSIDDLPDLNKIHSYLNVYNVKEYQHKGVVFHGPYFNDVGTIAVVEIKSLDNKHRWLAQLDFENQKLLPFEYQYDEAWIGGPGISGWNEESGNVGFINKSNVCYFQSEETGFSHLYTYNFDTKERKALTSGNFEIHEAYPNHLGTHFYISSNKSHAGNRSFYSLEIKNQKWIDLLVDDGKYDVILSSDEKQLFYTYSFINKPTELFVAHTKDLKTKHQITASLKPTFKERTWMIPEIIAIKASDGKNVNARLYKPKSEVKNNAAVIFVHGAGYLQNAHNWWSLYFREYMFHNFLVEQGYTVLDIDYRASEGYGRDFRTDIYRNMGGKDLSDQLDGRQYLIDNFAIDENKIGIYGGSYGGFITLMALLKEPGKFKCGAALRSVTDWAHYNHEYTSNILNTPEMDSLAFQVSSPIYFAENLQDHLLMLHGMVDDNVQFQDVVRLSQRFIELGKDNWELAVFPIEDHGFKTASSWTDEYKRIFNLFEKNLLGK